MPDPILESAENDSLFVLSNIFIVDSDSRLSISVIRSLILPGNPSVLSTHWVDIFLIGAYKGPDHSGGRLDSFGAFLGSRCHREPVTFRICLFLDFLKPLKI